MEEELSITSDGKQGAENQGAEEIIENIITENQGAQQQTPNIMSEDDLAPLMSRTDDMQDENDMSVEGTNEEDDDLHNEDDLLPPIIPRDKYTDNDEDDDAEDDEEITVDDPDILFCRSSRNANAPNNYKEFSGIRGYSGNRRLY